MAIYFSLAYAYFILEIVLETLICSVSTLISEFGSYPGNVGKYYMQVGQKDIFSFQYISSQKQINVMLCLRALPYGY